MNQNPSSDSERDTDQVDNEVEQQEPEVSADTPSENETIEKPKPKTDNKASTNADIPTESAKSGKLKAIATIAVILLLGLIASGLWKAYQPQTIELQGRVEAETIHISTKVPSRIEEFYVFEGQTIKKGQALVRFVSPELEAKKNRRKRHYKVLWLFNPP